MSESEIGNLTWFFEEDFAGYSYCLGVTLFIDLMVEDERWTIFPDIVPFQEDGRVEFI